MFVFICFGLVGCLLVFAVNTRLAAVGQTLKVENAHQSRNESQGVAHQPIKESPAFSEKQETLNAGISAQEDTSPIHKFEQPVRPTVAVEQSPVKQEKAEPG